MQGDIAGSYQLAARALGLAEQVPELAGQAHFAVAGSLLSLGSPGRAVGHFDLARDLSVGAMSLTVGTRPEVHAEAWSAHARWLLGDDEGAARARAESLARAREVHHPYTLAVALAYAAITHQMADEPDALDEVLDELTKLCARYDLAYYREWAVVLSGWRLGGAEGITAMRFGLARLTEEHALSRMPYWLSLLAEVHQRQGDTQAMRAAVDAAQVAALQHDDRWWLPEVLRQSASLQPSDVSAKTLQRAAAMATEQTSVALLRRCQVDLDRLGVRETSPADAVRRMQPNA